MIPSLERIDRTLQAELAYTLSRLKVLERIPGNPIGVAYRRIDENAMALMARHLPVEPFNSVVGLRKGHQRHIEAVVAWYRDNQSKGHVQVVPGLCDHGLTRELARHGYFQSGFHVSLIGEPQNFASVASEIPVEPVTSAALMEEFLDAYVAGWTIGEQHRDQFKANVRPWLAEPGWSLYLARIDGRAAGAAILYLHDKVGYCADAATDPAFRGRGLHTALLHRRIRDAGAAGAEFVCSGAAFLSQSHRNMERIGLRTQFVRALWTPLPEGP
jgi:ribosomal protein S18 acetylase RimI-like enzyme